LATTLVLVRHGEARAGVERFVGGDNGCKGLTDRGREQAAQLRDRLARTGELAPDVVLASTLPRAIETAEIVRAAFDASVPFATDRDYCEQHPGECDGMSVDEAERIYGLIDADDPDKIISPGGESRRMFDARIERALTTVLETHADRTIVMFTHGGFVYGATMYLLSAPGIAAPIPGWTPPRNTSLTIFTIDTAGARPLLERYNDHLHLLDGYIPS
jgi:probable phosphoglycerate mutase